MTDPKTISAEDAQRMFDYIKNNVMDVPLPQWLQDIAGETAPEPENISPATKITNSCLHGKFGSSEAVAASLDNAFCNAILAVQDNYTYDFFEQAQMVRNLAKCSTVEELNATLENCDIHGYDLNMPMSVHVKSIKDRSKQTA